MEFFAFVTKLSLIPTGYLDQIMLGPRHFRNKMTVFDPILFAGSSGRNAPNDLQAAASEGPCQVPVGLSTMES